MSSQKKEKKKTKDRSSAEKEKPSPKSKLDYNSKEVEDATIIFQSYIRSYVDAAALKRLKSMIKRRMQVVEEIRSTEVSYVNHLQTIVQVYMYPLKADVYFKTLLSEGQFKAIFSDIEVIMNFNKLFLQQFEDRLKGWDPKVTKLGDTFTSIADFLKVYTRYINNYGDATATLREVLNSSKEFATFISERTRTTGQADLEFFLIMPIQRIPRYGLLLADLAKNTWEHHPDFANLVKAKEKIGEIAVYLNEQKRKTENQARIRDIASKIITDSALGERLKLINPTRKFYREGEAIEIDQSGDKTSFYMLLFNDLLIWTSAVLKKKDTAFKYVRHVSMSEIIVKQAYAPDGRLGVSVVTSLEQVLFVFKSEKVSEDWYNDLITLKGEVKQTGQDDTDYIILESNEVFETKAQKLQQFEKSVESLLSAFDNAVQAHQALDEKTAILRREISGVYGNNEGRLTGMVYELKMLEDPIKDHQAGRVMKTLTSGLDNARQFYFYAIDSFKDRLLIREILRQRYDKIKSAFLRSCKKQQKLTSQKIDQFESLRNSFRDFSRSLLEDLNIFQEQALDSFDDVVLAHMTYQLHQGTKIDWMTLNNLVSKGYNLLDTNISELIQTRSTDPKILEELLKNPVCVDYFKRFLTSEHSEENLLFYLEVQEFQRMKDTRELKYKSKQIYKMYVKKGSPSEINLDASVRNELRKFFKKGEDGGDLTITNTIFDESSREVLNLMKTDSFERFVKSPFFEKMLFRIAKKDIFEYSKPEDYDSLQKEKEQILKKTTKEKEKLNKEDTSSVIWKSRYTADENSSSDPRERIDAEMKDRPPPLILNDDIINKRRATVASPAPTNVPNSIKNATISPTRSISPAPGGTSEPPPKKRSGSNPPAVALTTKRLSSEKETLKDSKEDKDKPKDEKSIKDSKDDKPVIKEPKDEKVAVKESKDDKMTMRDSKEFKEPEKKETRDSKELKEAPKEVKEAPKTQNFIQQLMDEQKKRPMSPNLPNVATSQIDEVMKVKKKENSGSADPNARSLVDMKKSLRPTNPASQPSRALSPKPVSQTPTIPYSPTSHSAPTTPVVPHADFNVTPSNSGELQSPIGSPISKPMFKRIKLEEELRNIQRLEKEASQTLNPQEESESVNIKVAVRVRNFLASEKNANVASIKCIPGYSQLVVKDRYYSFDYVFAPATKQQEMFKETVEPLIDYFLKGYNVSILAYGQTGSGKTYTMGMGDPNIPTEVQGILPRAITLIYDRIEKLKAEEKGRIEVNTKMTYIEIYNEDIRDLLNNIASTTSNIQIHESPTGIYLTGVTEVKVDDRDSMDKMVVKGSASRMTRSTLMNDVSSRSHSIMTLFSSISFYSDESKTTLVNTVASKINFVDLAGSERLSKTKAEGIQLKEGISINSGLLALGNVISALSNKKRKHVPYRDSKLTRLLQDSLGGNSRTLMIACVSPVAENLEESHNTVRYASHARHIENKAVVNVDPTTQELNYLRQQVKMLSRILEQYKRGLQVIKETVLLSAEDDTPSDPKVTEPSSNVSSGRSTPEVPKDKEKEKDKPIIQEQKEESPSN